MKKISSLAALLLGASTLAMNAQAQTAQSAAPTAAPAAQSNQIEEVMVTAERRSESLQKVPIAVSVVSADELSDRNLHGLTDLQFITPSVIGRRLTLSPLAIFLSIAFWTWLWGPLGTLLATPILLIATTIYQHVARADEPGFADWDSATK